VGDHQALRLQIAIAGFRKYVSPIREAAERWDVSGDPRKNHSAGRAVGNHGEFGTYFVRCPGDYWRCGADVQGDESASSNNRNVP
jgi:hypothetical protein